MKYSCKSCGKVFHQKGHYTKHLQRKTPCKPVENELINEKVQEKIGNLIEGGIIQHELHPPTEEQSKILEALKHSNVEVDAVAGSGKTTTILHIAKAFPDISICCITYNAKLKNETKQRITSMGLRNLIVFTYHGSCNKFYINESGLINDQKIIDTVSENKCLKDMIQYDMFIVDEVQDMNFNYAQYIQKVLSDNQKKDYKMVILGDKHQCINKYNESNFRFLTMGHEIFKNEHDWERLSLSETFRVPCEITHFLNDVMLQETRIISNKVSGYKPRYLITNTFSNYYNCNFLLKEVQYYLNFEDEFGNKLYKPEDIFILSCSVKSRGGNNSVPIMLANALSSTGILVHVTNEENEGQDEKLMKNKVVFTTYNACKGLERKVVIALGFDEAYFRYYDKDADKDSCPNKLYVGVTRSLERLTLVHHYETGFLPFLKGKSDEEKEEIIEKYCIINPTDGGGNIFRMRKKEVIKEKIRNEHIATNLISHLKSDIIGECKGLFSTQTIIPKGELIRIDSKVQQSETHWESVSEITGNAIPLYYALKEFGHDINDTYIKLNGNDDHINILRISNTSMSKFTGEYYKLEQIKKYNWLSPNQLKRCIDRLNTVRDNGIIRREGIFEKIITHQNNENESYLYKLIGRVDYMDEDNVVEFKCVKSLEIEHMLQLLLYKYILEKEGYKKKYYLYNVYDGHLLRLDSTLENMETIVWKLIKTKYIDKEKYGTDESFLEELKARDILV